MKHRQFVLDDETDNELKKIIRNSEKTNQEYFEDLIKEVIKRQKKSR